MADGDLNQSVAIQRQDELGDLATAFNAMARQLGELIDNLEGRVSARTDEAGAQQPGAAPCPRTDPGYNRRIARPAQGPPAG